MSADKTTPRPWWADNESENGDYGIYRCREDGEHGETIAVARGFDNAELIARAVNAHDDLVAALGALLGDAVALWDAYNNDRAVLGWDPSPEDPPFTAARNALAKARGETP